MCVVSTGYWTNGVCHPGVNTVVVDSSGVAAPTKLRNYHGCEEKLKKKLFGTNNDEQDGLSRRDPAELLVRLQFRGEVYSPGHEGVDDEQLDERVLRLRNLHDTDFRRTVLDVEQAEIRAQRSSQPVEHHARDIFDNWIHANSAGIDTRAEELWDLSQRMRAEFHPARPCLGFLDVDVRSLEAAGARRHALHSAEKAAADISPLVPSHNRAALLVVLVHRVHGLCPMVRRDELLCSLDNVLVLRPEGDALFATKGDIDGDNGPAAHPDDSRLRDKHMGLPVSVAGPEGMRHIEGQHQIQPHDVLQLLRALRAVLLQRLSDRCASEDDEEGAVRGERKRPHRLGLGLQQRKAQGQLDKILKKKKKKKTQATK